MRVVHLRTSGGVYGAERVLLTLAAEQLRQGLDVTVLCVDPPGQSPFAAALRARGIPAEVVPMGGRVDLRGAVGLLARIRQLAPDVLHSHGYKTDAVLAALRLVATRPALPPLVATNHNWTGATLALRAYEALDAVALRAFDRVVAVSRAVKGEMTARRVPAERIAVVPNGIAPPALADRAAARAHLAALAPIPAAAPLVGYLGRLSAEKGVRELVEAAAAPALAQLGAHVALVGEGPLRGEVEAGVARHAVASRVHLLGWHEDAGRLLAGFDLLVLPSWREGIPLAALEAMAAGVPVVASRVGGMPDVIDDGRTGLLVPARDPAALAAALASLLRDPARRSAMARAAAEVQRERFSAAAMAQAYDEVYRAVTGAVRAPLTHARVAAR